MAHHGHHHHHHRRRNPLGIDRATIKLALWGTAGGVGAQVLPAVLLPSQNSSWIGYAMNVASALVLKMAGDATIGKDAGDGLLVGGLVGTGIRIVKDFAGSSIPGLSAYWPSYFPLPTVSNPYGQVLQSPYPAPALPAAAAGRSASMGRFAGGRFAGRRGM